MQILEKEKNKFASYSISDLQNIKSARKSGFIKEFRVLFTRLIVSFFRAPIFVWSVFGNALFTSFLVSQLFYQTGAFALKFDLETNKRGVQNWVGYSFYQAIDMFIVGLMSQVVPLPTRLPLYRKEKLSGMYSAHSYYMSLWLVMTILLIQYPIIVTVLTHYILGFQDTSFQNFIEHLLTNIFLVLVGSNFGFMWSTLFKSAE